MIMYVVFIALSTGTDQDIQSSGRLLAVEGVNIRAGPILYNGFL